jgi:sulfate transport system substrate-binding protein
MQFIRPFCFVAVAGAAPAPGGVHALLNVSYDVSRELYKELNPAFSQRWRTDTGQVLSVNQSHGGSTAQAQAVANGLEADVVTMNQGSDIDLLVDRGLVGPDWRSRLPNGAAPYTTPSVFLVRKGNPRKILDWSDLARPGVAVILPNPKTSGNGRYAYLGAWGSVISHGGDEAQARAFVGRLLGNVPVFDAGGRGATTTFTQRHIGDVLVTFECEAALIAREVASDQFEVVYPPVTIEAPAPVAVVDRVVDRKGSRAEAQAYLAYLYSPAGQAIIARHGFRPRDAAALKDQAGRFPAVRTFSVETLLGGWRAVLRQHFADGAVFDQLVARRP